MPADRAVDWDLERLEDGAALRVVDPPGRQPWRLRLGWLVAASIAGAQGLGPTVIS